MSLKVYRLGRVEYEDGLELQRAFGEAVRQKLSPNVLLLLEHPPVITLGRGAKAANILASPQALAENGVEIFETNRGGDVTYHGPGQIVGYPIFQLEGKRQDVRRYVRDVEEALIRTLARYGIRAGRIPQWTGVWVGEGPGAEKIGAIGVHISRWQTSHGFALNVNTDLSHFRWIIPCGIHQAGVTSMARHLGVADVEIAAVERAIAESFGEVFGASVEEADFDLRTVSVCLWRRDRQGPKVLLLRRTAERGGFWQIVTGRSQPGESAAETAARELLEETGLALAPSPLGYTHAFNFQKRVPPLVVQETAFAAFLPKADSVQLDGREHDAHDWVSPEEADRRLPFKGLRNAVHMALAQPREIGEDRPVNVDEASKDERADNIDGRAG